ncbi:MAG: cell division topological specificity factor MinE [Panacagrimonas sp.]
MDWLGLFRPKKAPTANTARDRLMMVVAIQRDNDGRRNSTGAAGGNSYLPQLREELLSVVRKYVRVPDSAVQVNVQRESGLEVLEMNITLPERSN